MYLDAKAGLPVRLPEVATKPSSRLGTPPRPLVGEAHIPRPSQGGESGVGFGSRPSSRQMQPRPQPAQVPGPAEHASTLPGKDAEGIGFGSRPSSRQHSARQQPPPHPAQGLQVQVAHTPKSEVEAVGPAEPAQFDPEDVEEYARWVGYCVLPAQYQE